MFTYLLRRHTPVWWKIMVETLAKFSCPDDNENQAMSLVLIHNSVVTVTNNGCLNCDPYPHRLKVRCRLEYCASVWDRHIQKHIVKPKTMQRRGARFIKRNNSSLEPGSVTTVWTWSPTSSRTQKATASCVQDSHWTVPSYTSTGLHHPAPSGTRGLSDQGPPEV